MNELRVAIVAVLDEDADVVAVTGNATDNCVGWDDIDDLGDMGIAYRFLPSIRTGPDFGDQEVTVQLACFGKYLDQAEALALLCETKLKHPALNAAGCDAAPLGYVKEERSFLEESSLRKRVDVDIKFTVKV